MTEISRIDQRWNQYAAPRFSSQRSRMLRLQLDSDVVQAYARLAADTVDHGGRLAFTKDDLLLAVILGLNAACEYCGVLFGLESWGVVRRNPLSNVQGANLLNTDFSLRSVAVCCRLCANAKGKRGFTDEQWRGILSELRKCDDAVARDAVRALGEGTSPTHGGCG